jgi:hypothetical protein
MALIVLYVPSGGLEELPRQLPSEVGKKSKV